MARNGVQFNMWLSEEEKARIQEKANKAGISMSEYIRRCALSRKIPQYGDVAVLREISAELGKIGSNLNQIAHHLNAGGSVYSLYYDLQEVIKDWNDNWAEYKATDKTALRNFLYGRIDSIVELNK